MATTPTLLKSAISTLIAGTGAITESALQWLIDILDAVAVGGGMAVGRGFGGDPAGQTLSTNAATSTKITGWANTIEARSIQYDAANQRLVVQAGGDGHFDFEFKVDFKGTVGVGYLLALRVSRAGVATFETDSHAEEFILNANQIGHVVAFPRVTGLVAGDWVELHGIATSAVNTFVLRQAQLRCMRVDSP
jgi:hypothetical protein